MAKSGLKYELSLIGKPSFASRKSLHDFKHKVYASTDKDFGFTVLASIALGYPAEHKKCGRTRTPYSKNKTKQKKERRTNEKKKYFNPN